MRPLQLAVLFIVFLFLFSCSDKSNRGGTVLSTQLLLDEVAGLPVDTVPAGSFISFTGETSRDSLWMKVYFDGNKGWLPRWTIALDAQAGYLTEDADVYETEVGDENEQTAGVLSAGTIVAVGKEFGNRSQIFYVWADGEIAQAWVATDRIAYDFETKPEYAQNVNPLAQLADYGESDVINVSVNLSGASQEFLDGLRTYFNIMADPDSNKITLAVDVAESELQNAVATIAKKTKGTQTEDYIPSLTWQYLSAFVAQTPDFVYADIGPRTDYIQYADEEFKTDMQQMRAFLMMRIDRSPENIQRLYDVFGDFLKYTLSDRDVSEHLQGLIETYDLIIAIPNYHRKCADVMVSIKKWDREHAKNGIIDGGYIVDEQRPLYTAILDPATANEGEYEYARLSRYSFWVRRFNEGNEQVVYNILKDLAAGDEPSAEVKTITCTFKAYEIGDCGHMMFDCGDYGESDISKLSEADKALWLDLALADSDGESTGNNSNPKYVGKSFTMKVGQTRGPVCNEGQGGEGKIPLLLGFRMN
jgi:CRISPR/Cas system CSM-associated protein Csm2 small subunit